MRPIKNNGQRPMDQGDPVKPSPDITIRRHPNGQTLFFLNGVPVPPKQAIDYYYDEIDPQGNFQDFFGSHVRLGAKARPQDVEKILAQLRTPYGEQTRGATYGSDVNRARVAEGGMTRSYFGGTDNPRERDSVAGPLLRGLADWGQ